MAVNMKTKIVKDRVLKRLFDFERCFLVENYTHDCYFNEDETETTAVIFLTYVDY